jgi:hypothetical protein
MPINAAAESASSSTVASIPARSASRTSASARTRCRVAKPDATATPQRAAGSRLLCESTLSRFNEMSRAASGSKARKLSTAVIGWFPAEVPLAVSCAKFGMTPVERFQS